MSSPRAAETTQRLARTRVRLTAVTRRRETPPDLTPVVDRLVRAGRLRAPRRQLRDVLAARSLRRGPVTDARSRGPGAARRMWLTPRRASGNRLCDRGGLRLDGQPATPSVGARQHPQEVGGGRSLARQY